MNDITMQLSFCSRVLLPFPGLQIALIQDWLNAVIAHFLISQKANGVGRGLEASDNHNVSNVKIDTYTLLIQTSIGPLEHDLTLGWYDRTVWSGCKWFTISDAHCWKLPRNVMNTNSRTSTLVNIPLKQMSYIKWKSHRKRKITL